MTEMVERADDPINATKQSTNSNNDRHFALQTLTEGIINQLPAELSLENSQRMRNILWKYSDYLSLNEFDLGYADLVEQTIDTGSATPIRQTLRRQLGGISTANRPTCSENITHWCYCSIYFTME